MRKTKAKDFDATFDRGEDVTQYLDKSKTCQVTAGLKNQQKMKQSSHLIFLRQAIDLSRVSLEAGGFPVAAILVKDGKEIAHGLSCTETSHDVTAHGEIQAIRTAGDSAIAPLTLYSSLEPCLMCLAASAWAGVTEIVYGCRKELVSAAYYINSVDVKEAARLLCRSPQFCYLNEFEEEVIALIAEYEKRNSGRKLL